MVSEKKPEGGDSVVLYPSPGIGHMVSMVELGKHLLRHYNLHVTVAVLDSPFNAEASAAFLSSIAAANPSMYFHQLPPVDLSHYPQADSHEALQLELIRLSRPSILSYLSTLAVRPKALVVDMFVATAVDVGRTQGIPVYIFFMSAASTLAVFLHLPTLHSATTQSFNDLGDSPVDVPGTLPIPANHMPLPMLDRNSDSYKGCLEQIKCYFAVDGIIVSTFESLERWAVQAIRDNGSVPPMYCVGPLIISERGREKGHDCLEWLDSQPKGSVVFLCFGSLGRFPKEQLQEIAVGLENSGQRFLWVVKSPPNPDPSEKYSTPPEPDLETLLPKGFSDRTRGRGLVVRSWAPQVAVLAHEAVGGFVTHLGWNSVLEGVCAGVGMVGWPLYAEQRLNRVLVADDLKLAMAMKGYDEELVTAEEVERRVRELMESEEGEELKRRCVEAKRAAEEALGDGGSSALALDQFMKSIF